MQTLPPIETGCRITFQFCCLFLSAIATSSDAAANRIINGTEVNIEQYPYQLSFRVRRQHICGASIISPTHGLTAAHCISPSHPLEVYSILAGVSKLSNEGDGQQRALSNIIKHPEFDQLTFRNDIAVLWFDQPFEFNGKIAAIDFPSVNDALPKIGSIVGWGVTRAGDVKSLSDHLRHVQKSTISNAQCDTMYANIYRIKHQMFCSYDEEGYYDACTGDDGGAYASGRFIYGISSWAYRCAHPRFPRVYTRVSAYIDWIKTNANMTETTAAAATAAVAV